MIWLEAAAAALVGVALLLVVLGPLISRSWCRRSWTTSRRTSRRRRRASRFSALKEIEFDQATGKLSDEDYAMLKGKYTAQALDALRAEDVSPGPGDLEAVIAERARAIRAQGSSHSTCPHCGPRPETDAIFCSTCGCALDARNCGGCAATLPPGSRFCDQCGTRVAA